MARVITVILATVAGLTTVSPALAQTGGVFDILTEMLRINRPVRGHVVQHREGTLILRGADKRTYTINTAGLDLDALRQIRTGRPVVVTLKTPIEGAMPIAASAEVADGPTKVFRRVDGSVEAVTDDRITFVTWEGRRLTLDRARIVGEAPQVAPHEIATLVYEQDPDVAGVWIEPREGESAASPRGER